MLLVVLFRKLLQVQVANEWPIASQDLEWPRGNYPNHIRGLTIFADFQVDVLSS